MDFARCAVASKEKILHTHKGGWILEIESGLCKASAEIRLDRLSHKRAAAIHDSSPKANASILPLL